MRRTPRTRDAESGASAEYYACAGILPARTERLVMSDVFQDRAVRIARDAASARARALAESIAIETGAPVFVDTRAEALAAYRAQGSDSVVYWRPNASRDFYSCGDCGAPVGIGDECDHAGRVS